MLFIVQLMLGIVILMTSIKDRKEQIMNKRTIQIDVIGKVEGTQFMNRRNWESRRYSIYEVQAIYK